MVEKKDKEKEIILDRSKSRLIRLQTECGFDVKPVYRPQDLEDFDYEEDLGDPGEYPFTRGIYEGMYRKMLWVDEHVLVRETIEKTRRELVPMWNQGYAVLYYSGGELTRAGVDLDHPLAKHDVGYHPEPYSLEAFDRYLAGISLESGIFQFHGASCQHDDVLSVAQLAALAEKRGVDKAKIRGSCINDPLNNKATEFTMDFPIEISMRLHGDLTEYIVKHMPKFTPFAPIGYNLYEAGCNSVQQLGIIIASLVTYFEAGLERGLSLEQLGRRTVMSMASCMDFFETVAKIRAARRMWARIAKERFGAQDPNLCRLRIAIRTPGMSLTKQQPLNNIGRIAFQALAAVLGGANTVDYSAHDEARCIPTEESRRVSIAMNHIIAQETGVALTADPLGGSYYVESLTNRMEEEAGKLMKEIDDMGGMLAVAESGWLRRLVVSAAEQRERDIEQGKLIQVGLNYFRIPEDEDMKVEEYQFEGMDKVQAEALADIKKFKESRDIKKTREALLTLREKAKGKENLMYPMIEAFKANATRTEILGMIREAYGYPYDTVGMVQRPSFLD
jgi:methylmalonyl-CoA mutase N-terminal domain/subunit